MVKAGLLCLPLVVVAVCLTAQDTETTGRNSPVTLRYLGAAGWKITEGTTDFARGVSDQA
jgi:hypothetical protein